ncbi:MAG: CRISPR-associated endonuclease Cas1 [Anaerolineae bacterium]
MSRQRFLFVEGYGAFVGRRSQRLYVKHQGKIVEEAPVLFLEQVLISGRAVTVSSDALALCAGQGIPVHYLSWKGTPYAAVYAAGLGGTVQTRRAQYMAYEDERGTHLASAFAKGKLLNQSRLLKYLAKSRKEKEPDVYQTLREAAKTVENHISGLKEWRATAQKRGLDEVRAHLLSIEGRAAQSYWEGLRAVVPDTLNWPGRRGRGARDAVNSALNYGYGVLYGQVERAIVLAGLDPYAGFIHADRPGKPSLVLDLIEEFRAPVVDRVIWGMIGLGMALTVDEKGLLAQETRRTIAERVLARLEESTERYERKRHKLRWILQTQARHIATYLRGERGEYKPFISGW